jgi:hypothetical protein
MSKKAVHLSVQKKAKSSVSKKIHLRDGFELEDFYSIVASGRLDSLHVPHSDVFFVRGAIRDTLVGRGMDPEYVYKLVTLESTERAMRAEGWSESRVLKPKRYKFSK